MPPTDLIRQCFIEPFGEGSSRTPRDLTPTARLLDAIMRRTLLLRIGYHEGLTRIQLWLLNSLIQQTVFDIWDLILSEMEDTLAEVFRGHRQLPYAHWITFLIHRAVTVRPPEMLAEYSGATIEFPAYNLTQIIRHSTLSAPSQPRRRLEVLETADHQGHSSYRGGAARCIARGYGRERPQRQLR